MQNKKQCNNLNINMLYNLSAVFFACAAFVEDGFMDISPAGSVMVLAMVISLGKGITRSVHFPNRFPEISGDVLLFVSQELQLVIKAQETSTVLIKILRKSLLFITSLQN